MYLKSLEINGFKSFAKKANLEFGTRIVSIVGPNGSGKSNVAEAFRFVLGEQSIKSMRGKRGEDLIWNGSKSTPKMNRAGVKLVFDNRNRIFKIDFDELQLERVVHRDGVNEYLINGSVVRLRDIVEILSQANIGASGHHIISQGEADRILSASSRERREMVEDALGLKVYQYKRTESEKKLEKTAENIKQVEGLRKEIAPHIKFLEKQVEKVKKAENLRQELFTLYQEYLAQEEKYLHDEMHALKTESEAPEQELSDIEKQIEVIRDVIEGKEGGDKDSHLILELEKKLNDVEHAQSVAKNNLSRIEGELAAQERIKRRTEQNSLNVSSLSVELSEVEHLQGEIWKIAGGANQDGSAGFFQGIIERIVKAFDAFVTEKKQKGVAKNNLEEIEHDIKKLLEQKEDQEKVLERVSGETKEVKKEYEEFKYKREEKSQKGREAERNLFSLMNRRTELNNILFSLDSRKERYHQGEEAFKNELNEAQALVGHQVLRFDSSIALGLGEERSLQEERRKRLERMKVRLEEAGAAGGEEVKKEYEETVTRDQFLQREIEDLEKSATTLKELIVELQNKIETEFKVGITKINETFNEFFNLMFGGGNASLALVKEEKRRKKSDLDDLMGEDEEEDVEEEHQEEGIEVSISLPHKRVRGLGMLSGGERALTSIALLFSISRVNPPPFIILDETDAALDEANSRKYGDMVEKLAQHSQLILITHNRETMSRAGILYGVTMGSDGFSKLLSVKFEEAIAVAK